VELQTRWLLRVRALAKERRHSVAAELARIVEAYLTEHREEVRAALGEGPTTAGLIRVESSKLRTQDRVRTKRRRQTDN
jgi:hypothetical protein